MRKHHEALGINLSSLDHLLQKLRVDHPDKWKQYTEMIITNNVKSQEELDLGEQEGGLVLNVDKIKTSGSN